MANKIQFKRGLEVDLPNLDLGEPALTTDTEKIYVGSSSGNFLIAQKVATTDKTIYVATTALGGRDADNNATGIELETGTTTATTANKLVDSTASFTSAIIDRTVYNSTDDTWAKVTAVDSATQLTLSADIMANGESYKIVDAFDNIQDAFDLVDSPYRVNFTVRVSPGTFSGDVTMVGKSAGANKTLTVRGSTTSTTTVSGRFYIRQRVALNKLTFTNKIFTYFNADVEWTLCTNTEPSKIYVYAGSGNTLQSGTYIFGNDPQNVVNNGATVTTGYTIYVGTTDTTDYGGVNGNDGLEITSGTATSTTSNKLVNSAASFTSEVLNKTVYNSTDDTWAKVTAVDSSTQLSLSANIMASGESYVIASATNSIQNALALVPGVRNCDTTIKVCDGVVYSPSSSTPAVVVRGKNYSDDHELLIEGTKDIKVTGTSTSSSTSTIVDSGKSWTVDAYKYMVVEITSGTGAGQFHAIESNTSTTLTVAGFFTTTPGSTVGYRIYDRRTEIRGSVSGAPTTAAGYAIILDGVSLVHLKNLLISYGLNSSLQFTGSNASVTGCWFLNHYYRALYIINGSILRIHGCSVRSTSAGNVNVASLELNASSSMDPYTSPFNSGNLIYSVSGAGGIAIFAADSSSIAIFNSTLDGYSSGLFARGIYCLRMSGGYSATTIVKNYGTGVSAVRNSSINVASFTFSGNSSNTSSDAATYSQVYT